MIEHSQSCRWHTDGGNSCDCGAVKRPKIERESIEDALENDRCGTCGSVEHFREDHPKVEFPAFDPKDGRNRPRCAKPGCIAWSAKYQVQYRGKCRDWLTVCGHHLNWGVDKLTQGCLHGGHDYGKPAILHVEQLRKSY